MTLPRLTSEQKREKSPKTDRKQKRLHWVVFDMSPYLGLQSVQLLAQILQGLA